MYACIYVCIYIYVHVNRTFFFMANAFQFQSTKSPVASLSFGTSKAKLKGAGRWKGHNSKGTEAPSDLL